MPIFNIIRVNQAHLAKVLTVRREKTDVLPIGNTDISGFIKWREYIQKQNRKRTSKLSATIEHILA